MRSKPQGNPFLNALRLSIEQLPPELLASLELTIDELLTSTPKTFSIYEPLLLLPAHAFATESWKSLLSSLSAEQKKDFFALMAVSLKVTHIAINAPISLATIKTPSQTGSAADKEQKNIQRRPNITPVHGDFGPHISIDPAAADLLQTLWVSTRQNGITQIWAPQYTMFSRGNITEKARILSLRSIRNSRGCTVVDMYAGIGYFSFSYAKAGAGMILGFEVNAWSVEGFKRGAQANGWDCQVATEPDVATGAVGIPLRPSEGNARATLVIFHMTNEQAADIVKHHKTVLPPVRHVNLGLLPTSRGAWRSALQCLDPDLGGWLHVHENFAIKDIPSKSEEVSQTIGKLAQTVKGLQWDSHLQHVEQVKTYAPGVMHCVLDIFVAPVASAP